MAKVKNKKRISADRIHSRKESNAVKKLNPFEVHINKEKLRVIGKKQRNDRGLPGVSRAKAIEKRKRTLLQEYNVQNKSNKFVDKRIGERNRNMTEEDKVMTRFTAVRIKAHKKKSIFNLADDEVLTHRGQILSEIEKFDDPRSDDEESIDRDIGALDDRFVEDAHFGGGMLKKTGVEGAKTHKDLIDQLIAESKKRKAEKQKTKEATLELTEKLDTEWKDLLPIVSNIKQVETEQISKVDDYDKVMRELKFEARGTVSDRLQTESEIVREEKEKLEMLEKERRERMNGFVEEVAKFNHKSADDLDDNIVYEGGEEMDSEFTLSYNTEGVSNLHIEAQISGKVKKSNNGNAGEEINEEGTDNEVSDEEVETESEDNLSDLKDKSSTSDSELEGNVKENNVTYKNSGKEVINYKSETEIHTEKDWQVEIRNDLLKRKEIMEQARNELPYTFSLPESYESLQKIFEKQSSSHQSIIIERMIKCNHPSIAEGNKDNLGLLFAYLLQYLNDLFTEFLDDKSIRNSFEIFKDLMTQIYSLAQINPENAHKSILEVVKEKYGEFRISSKEYPGLEVLIFFKLVSLLFSTSDFRHQIVTPCFVFMEQMLNKCKVRNRRDISYGLFIVTLSLEYTWFSKRYFPAAVNFLSGIIHMAIPKGGVKLIKVTPPFKSTSSQLVLLENHSLGTLKSFHMEYTDFLHTEIEEVYKVRVLYNTVKMLEEFYNYYCELPSCVEIFDTALKYLELIPLTDYPKEVKNGVEHLIIILKQGNTDRKLKFIVMEAKKPKVLKLYEPKIVEVYDGKKFKIQSKAKAERDKLLHKLKKEKKGALREVRRDNAFLGRIKIHQRIQSDKERREKVKRIYAEAALQQSELNKWDRKNKRKK